MQRAAPDGSARRARTALEPRLTVRGAPHEADRTWRGPRPRRVRGHPRAVPRARHRREEGAPRRARPERLVRVREPRHGAHADPGDAPHRAHHARGRDPPRDRDVQRARPGRPRALRDGAHRDRREGRPREVPLRGEGARPVVRARRRRRALPRQARRVAREPRPHDRGALPEVPARARGRARAPRRAREGAEAAATSTIELVVEHPRYSAKTTLPASLVQSLAEDLA